MKYALHMAVGSLKNWKNAYPDEFDEFDEDALKELEKLLAQPEQEPACFVYPEFFGRLKIAGSATAYLTNGKNGEYPDGVERICLFRAPPQRTWVGLTDEDFQMIYDIGRTPAGMMEMVEAKLKEKNNG